MEKYLIIYGHKNNTSYSKEITWRETKEQKALYWIPEKPKDFGKLISCLVDYLATGGYEK